MHSKDWEDILQYAQKNKIAIFYQPLLMGYDIPSQIFLIALLYKFHGQSLKVFFNRLTEFENLWPKRNKLGKDQKLLNALDVQHKDPFKLIKVIAFKIGYTKAQINNIAKDEKYRQDIHKMLSSPERCEISNDRLKFHAVRDDDIHYLPTFYINKFYKAHTICLRDVKEFLH